MIPEDALPVGGRRPPAKWAAEAGRKARVAPRRLEAAVVRALREIRQMPVKADSCATAAHEVIGLWRALGTPDPDRFAGELVLVARAAQMSASRIFARDVRAEGWKDGTDRTYSIKTLCARGRWDDRLREATRWAEHSGRVGPIGEAMASRRRPLTPEHSTWESLQEPETMMAAYLRVARAALGQEAADGGHREGLRRIDALEGRPGTEADLSEVVRAVLDAIGEW